MTRTRARSVGPALLALAASLALGIACQERPPARPEVAARAIASLRTELGAALKGALAEGPESAIEVCQVEAPAIAKKLERPGLTMGRTSDRLRNPANAPEEWVLPFLEEFRDRAPEPGAYRSVDLGPRGVGYVEPIHLQPLCTTCHGENVDPSLLEAIRARYPKDRAIGFRVGELRGLFWAVISREAAASG